MTSANVESLESLIRSRSSARDAEARPILLRLGNEIKSRSARSSEASLEFVEASVRALIKLKGSANAALRMECLLDSGAYLYSNCRNASAVVAGAACESLARQIKDRDLASKSQLLQAMANAELGNIAQAVVQGCEAFQTARQIDSFKRQLAALINLGVALHYGGLYREAIACHERVLVMLENEPQNAEEQIGHPLLTFKLAALTNKAQSYYALGDFPRSYRAISECLVQTPQPEDAMDCQRRAIREFTFVQAALELGKLSAARDHARLCHEFAQRAFGRAKVLAQISGALCEVHGGDSAKGVQSLETLLRGTHETSDEILILDTVARCYEQIGRPEQALDRLHELLARMSKQRTADVVALLVNVPAMAEVLTSAGPDALAVRESNLRAKVAERRLVSERFEMFERLAIAADLKEDASGRHGYRVGRLAALLAAKLNWDQVRSSEIEIAARLHDIGKMAIPDRILTTSQELLDADWRLLTAHAAIGKELLSKAQASELSVAEQIAHCHHEWWDGTGYPSKLSGKRIPIHARIVALADVFDALTHGRPYAPAWPIDRALEEIRQRRGTQFDPDLTDAFLALIEELRTEHADLDAYLAEASRNSPFLQAREKIRLMLEGARPPENMAAAAAQTVH
jgi:putative two-component system response regulator